MLSKVNRDCLLRPGVEVVEGLETWLGVGGKGIDVGEVVVAEVRSGVGLGEVGGGEGSSVWEWTGGGRWRW